MNEWHLLACLLMAGVGACGWGILARGFRDGIVALQLAGVLGSLALLALAEAERREPFGDLAIVLALASLVGSLILARYVERAGRDDRG